MNMKPKKTKKKAWKNTTENVRLSARIHKDHSKLIKERARKDVSTEGEAIRAIFDEYIGFINNK